MVDELPNGYPRLDSNDTAFRVEVEYVVEVEADRGLRSLVVDHARGDAHPVLARRTEPSRGAGRLPPADLRLYVNDTFVVSFRRAPQAMDI